MKDRPLRLNRLERVVLDLVRRGQGRLSWHGIATRLSALDLPRQPGLFAVLTRLEELGLLERVARGEGMDHWAITARAEEALEETARVSEQGDADQRGLLARSLLQGPEAAIVAIREHIDDPARLETALREIVAEDVSTAEGVATAALCLPEQGRTSMTKSLSEDPRAEVRRALFRAWGPARMEVQGSGWQGMADEEWDQLLRRGLTDSDAEVRGLATAMVFGSARGARFVTELLANLESGMPELRHRTILALGSADDRASLEALQTRLAGSDLSEAAAVVRALGARPDGRALWRAALDEERGEVRRAALFALARVVTGLDEHQLQALDDPASPDDLRAAVSAYRARTDSS